MPERILRIHLQERKKERKKERKIWFVLVWFYGRSTLVGVI